MFLDLKINRWIKSVRSCCHLGQLLHETVLWSLISVKNVKGSKQLHCVTTLQSITSTVLCETHKCRHVPIRAVIWAPNMCNVSLKWLRMVWAWRQAFEAHVPSRDPSWQGYWVHSSLPLAPTNHWERKPLLFLHVNFREHASCCLKALIPK